MYFVLTSLLSFVSNPAFYIFCCLAGGWLLRNRRWKRGLYGAGIFLLLLFSNQPLLEFAQKQWYAEYDRPLPAGKTYRYGIVLGGYSNWDWERNRVEFSEIADRLLQGIYLYKHKRIEKLVLASDGAIIENESGRGPKGNLDGMKDFLDAMGMPDEDVIYETRARNTRENVTLTAELLGGNLHASSALLITSAIHMRRSIAAFRAAGLDMDCYITDTPVKVPGQRYSWLPSVWTMARWPELLHEWIGYVVYKIRGW